MAKFRIFVRTVFVPHDRTVPYGEAVTFQSPASATRRSRDAPRWVSGEDATPLRRRRYTRTRALCNPFGVWRRLRPGTQGAAAARRPWALGFNAFGVRPIAEHISDHKQRRFISDLVGECQAFLTRVRSLISGSAPPDWRIQSAFVRVFHPIRVPIFRMGCCGTRKKTRLRGSLEFLARTQVFRRWQCEACSKRQIRA